MKLIYTGKSNKLTYGKSYQIYINSNGINFLIDDIGNKQFLSNIKEFKNLDEWRLIHLDKYFI